jgi:hypothetical protein
MLAKEAGRSCSMQFSSMSNVTKAWPSYMTFVLCKCSFLDLSQVEVPSSTIVNQLRHTLGAHALRLDGFRCLR